MRDPKTRQYDSSLRKRQAEETKKRVASAARELLARNGYEGMTIEAVAREAGVSPQTVYATFGSKRGILAAIVDVATFGDEYSALVQQSMGTADPVERLRIAAAISRRVHDAQEDVLQLFMGASVVAPELSATLKAREDHRYEAQAHLAELLHTAGRLKPGLDVSDARAILWTFTSRDMYRMLVQERGWPSDKYERWLADTLVRSLAGD